LTPQKPQKRKSATNAEAFSFPANNPVFKDKIIGWRLYFSTQKLKIEIPDQRLSEPNQPTNSA
jgi:hypothetical protein